MARQGPAAWAALLRAVTAALLLSEVVAVASQLDRPGLDSSVDAQCVLLAPRILTTQQKQLLCSAVRLDVAETGDDERYYGSDGLGDGDSSDAAMPAKCASLALESRATQPSATKRETDSVLPHVLALCANARDLAPVNCWLHFSMHQRLHQVTPDAPSPFVDVCRSAQDAAPAKCLRLWLHSSAFLLARDALEEQPEAIRVCRSVRQHMVSEFAACVKKGVRLVGVAASFPLCEFVMPESSEAQDSSSRRQPVIECARTLARQRLPATAIAEACAKATSSPRQAAVTGAGLDSPVRPEACMLEAQRSLTQWMDAAVFGALCDQAMQGSTAPVECASKLKQDAFRRLQSLPSAPRTSQTQRRRQLSEFIARMCRGTTDGSAVGACVQLLPSKTLSIAQSELLCSARAITRGDSPDGSSASAINLSPAHCVARADPILTVMNRHRSQQRPTTGDDDRSSIAALLVRLCEQAASLAPSECLASVHFDRRLSTELAVDLCRRASSDAPQRCLRRLQPHISSSRVAIEDAVTLCNESGASQRPHRAVDCAERALSALGTHVPDTSSLVMILCTGASSAAPAECFHQAPSTYSPTEKAALCRQASTVDPARCASQHLARLTAGAQSHQHQIDLCHGATSQAPAQCAKEAPYGMSAREIVLLCARATSSMPANCARAVSPTLRLPPEAVARVCSRAASTLPARCLSKEASVLLRRSEPITSGVIRRCRDVHAELTSLEIAHVAYDCKQLRVNCALSLSLQAFDQFGDEMLALNAGHLHASAEYEAALNGDSTGSLGSGNASTSSKWPLSYSGPPRSSSLSGRTVVPIVNGSAVFSDLVFSSPGRYALRFHELPDGLEKIAWIRIHPDVEAESRVRRCHALFLDQFQCAAACDASGDQQLLELPRQLFFHAVDCQQHWATTAGGLAPLPAPRQLAFSIPRTVYDLLIHTDVPRADMSSWERLGVAVGSNRSAVRRAYHRRSLEWHPDKWRAVDLLPAWRRELDSVYALVTQAYTELLERA